MSQKVMEHPSTCSCLASVDEWYASYATIVRRYLLLRVHDPLAADECTSETFLRVIANRQRFRCAGQGVGPWLFTIARNIALDYRKKAWRRLEITVDCVPDHHDLAPTPDQRVVREELREALHQCIAQLTADQRRCVQLRFLAGLSVEQTAELMCRDRSAVRSLQLRAVRKLATLFRETAQHDSWSDPAPADRVTDLDREVRWVPRWSSRV